MYECDKLKVSFSSCFLNIVEFEKSNNTDSLICSLSGFPNGFPVNNCFDDC